MFLLVGAASAVGYVSQFGTVFSNGNMAVGTSGMQITRIAEGKYCAWHPIKTSSYGSHSASLQGHPNLPSLGSIIIKEKAVLECGSGGNPQLLPVAIYTFDTEGHPTDRAFTLSAIDTVASVSVDFGAFNGDGSSALPSQSTTVQKLGTGVYCVQSPLSAPRGAIVTLLQTNASRPTSPPFQGLIYANSIFADHCNAFLDGTTVYTFDSSGNPSDSGFSINLFSTAPPSRAPLYSDVRIINGKIPFSDPSSEISLTTLPDKQNGLRYCFRPVMRQPHLKPSFASVSATVLVSMNMSLVNPVTAFSTTDCLGGWLIYFFLPFYPRPTFFVTDFVFSTPMTYA